MGSKRWRPVHSPKGCKVRLVQAEARSVDLCPGLPCECKKQNIRAILHCFARHVSRGSEVEQPGLEPASHMGCCGHRLQLNPPHHDSGPSVLTLITTAFKLSPNVLLKFRDSFTVMHFQDWRRSWCSVTFGLR